MSRFNVKQVAVLGAGVMGAQIAAQLVNLKVPVILFDLPAKEGPKNGIVLKAVAALKKLKPSPLGVASDADLIEAANYDDDLKKLKGCDLIIEAIAERMDWKSDLYHKIAASVGKDVWEGGKILDPENGKTYTLRMTPIEDGKKLEVRGSIGPFGRTQTWIRVQ